MHWDTNPLFNGDCLVSHRHNSQSVLLAEASDFQESNQKAIRQRGTEKKELTCGACSPHLTLTCRSSQNFFVSTCANYFARYKRP